MKKKTIKKILKGDMKVTPKKIKNFIHAKVQQVKSEDWSKDQEKKRLSLVKINSPECFNKEECFCGCTFEDGFLLQEDPCERNCFSKWKNEKEWENYININNNLKKTDMEFSKEEKEIDNDVYFDTEFIEIPKFNFLGKEIKNSKVLTPISIALVTNKSEIYLISKEFNVKYVWNHIGTDGFNFRTQILKPVFERLVYLSNVRFNGNFTNQPSFNLKNFKVLLNRYGLTNKEIQSEIVNNLILLPKKGPIKLYAYYSSFDFVVLCNIFEGYNNLNNLVPSLIPYFVYDLKALLNDKVEFMTTIMIKAKDGQSYNVKFKGFEERLKIVKEHIDFPENNKEHDCLSDTIWNKELHTFIKELK